MSGAVPRLRMFAGPNGSGKSTLKEVLPRELLGTYLNPDDIESRLSNKGLLDLTAFGLSVNSAEALRFFQESPRLVTSGGAESMSNLRFAGNRLDFTATKIDAYVAAEAAAFLADQLLIARRTFTIETVMSHPSKVELLSKARQHGFRTYLYYVATADPDINVSRVRNRVALGGHDVPEDRIRSRYERSLALLTDAIKQTHRAYVFDNSSDDASRPHTWIAEVTNGRRIEIKVSEAPSWFDRHVLQKALPHP